MNLLKCGFSYSDILEMSWHQVDAYITAYDADENERLVLLMNVMAVANAGTAKNRKEMAEAILGISNDFDIDAFEGMADIFLANNIKSEEKDTIKEWALANFNADDPAFVVKGR